MTLNDFATADVPARASSQTVCMLEARPRSQPKPLPVFPNPAHRPEGSLPPLALRFYTGVLDGTVIALGKAPGLDTELFLRAIKVAGDQRRSIRCYINSAGGSAESFLAIATALLRHPFAVHALIAGRCSSAASFIALAADRRVIAKNGYVLLHTTRRLYTPDQWDAVCALPQNVLGEINDSMADVDDAQIALLTQRLGISEAVARQWLSEDSKWTPEEALARGFVHEIDGEV